MATNIISEPLVYAGEFILSEAPGRLSRDDATVPAGVSIAPGMVVSVSINGVASEADASATDGTEVASGIAIIGIGANDDYRKMAVFARDGEVKIGFLRYKAGTTAGQIATHQAALATRHIVAR